ncbi:NAD(P)/FAD-dependent oxidoreductase [Haloarcula salinisoli]|uniref:NAD(P)/FAD-dependent oxidoreductase n=1 Tax=Haloarcula salinisoli TaxID=2487746 RepID=A0A8J7YFV4_9EURY|nr:NAD(P)/FAD-dependent oxidoreductase [Halomicroarcula salinisoli]MBX0287272.1 NAD(P)/FAD-dependent oxidoreductase [Halomicroarcula salinisoli]MBX0305165.1 NAD(P)/FAD-dependent oxidoreductase [Halomicroarcula salinisoli]
MIGVVGGGVAGLAAAYRLQQRGHEVRVFEASEDLGGLAAVYETAGDPIEKFYHHLSKSEETIVELAEELGLGDDVEWRIGENGYYVDGVVHPMDKPWEILAFPHLSFYDKFRLGMLTLDIDVRGGVPKFDTYEKLEDFEDIPVEEFVRDHTTQNVYETFFEPLLDAKFGSRKGDVSAAWLLGRIKFRGERDILNGEILGYLDGGFGRLLDALVEAVGRENIETGTRVTDVLTDYGAVSGLTADDGDGETTHDVDDVVVAAMPNVLEDLTGYPCEIDFQGTVCSVISMDEPLLDTYWLNIADEAPFGALIEHTNFVERERYGGEHLLYVARYIQSPEEDLWQQDDDEVRETWLSGIESLFPEFDRESVNWVQTARNPRTAPVYERGYLDMVVPYDLADEVADGVYYAGMASEAQYPERSLNGGIVAGYEVADRIDGRESTSAE